MRMTSIAVWLMVGISFSVPNTLAQNKRSCEVERYTAAFSGGFLPNCDPNGLYEPVQCHDKECWCVKDTGEEIANTRVKSPSLPNCDYPALGATEVDLVKAVIKYRGEDITFNPYSFGNKSSYDFQSSSSVYAFARDYLPPNLWPDFSILATIRPMTLEGGFLFAVTDGLEAVIQLGVSVSKGDNEYTQHIDLWYSEDPMQRGTVKIAQFTVPTMVGRWSRFAIGVNGTNIHLHLYCQQNYAVHEYKRTHTQLKFMDSSFLLVGHGGEIFAERFKGEVQELLLTNDPADAVNQCMQRKEETQKQMGPLTKEFGSGSDELYHFPIDGVIGTDDESQLLTTTTSHDSKHSYLMQRAPRVLAAPAADFPSNKLSTLELSQHLNASNAEADETNSSVAHAANNSRGSFSSNTSIRSLLSKITKSLVDGSPDTTTPFPSSFHHTHIMENSTAIDTGEEVRSMTELKQVTDKVPKAVESGSNDLSVTQTIAPQNTNKPGDFNTTVHEHMSDISMVQSSTTSTKNLQSAVSIATVASAKSTIQQLSATTAVPDVVFTVKVSGVAPAATTATAPEVAITATVPDVVSTAKVSGVAPTATTATEVAITATVPDVVSTAKVSGVSPAATMFSSILSTLSIPKDLAREDVRGIGKPDDSDDPDDGSGFWDNIDNGGFDPDAYDYIVPEDSSVPDVSDRENTDNPELPGGLIIDNLGNKGFDPDAPEDITTMGPTTTAIPVEVTWKAEVPAPEGHVEIDDLPDFIGIPGETGEKGEKGDTGDVGPIGIGIKGDKGDPGNAGLPGKHGINGIPGMEGAIGPSGLHGPKGSKGEAGVGERGPPGVSGESIWGEKGEAGVKGGKGEVGEGMAGPKGEPGSSFFAELEELMAVEGSGEDIEDLFTGLPALELLRGPKGEIGNCTAVDGIPGTDGAHGRDGQPGLPGSSGARGMSGIDGAQGVAGPKGDSGMNGDSGVAGPKGEKGVHGERGPQGLQGPPGPPAVIDIDGRLEAEQGEPGAPGMDGEPGDQGEKGAAGENGVKGERGERGVDGVQGPSGMAGADGRNGAPGAPGLQGADGLNGTKGEKGETGDGLPGPAGPPGPPGVSAGKPFFGGDLTADDLPSGLKGEKGEDGAPGTIDLDELNEIIPLLKEKGDKGDQGNQGKDGGCKMCVGFKGSRGRRGQRGTKGNAGVAGPKGMIGAPGFPGRDGIPGAPGTPGDSIKGEKGDVSTCECGNMESGIKGVKGEPGLVINNGEVVAGPPGPPGPSGESVVGPQGPRGLPGRSNGRMTSNLGNVVMYPSQAALTGSSLAMPTGTLGFVMDQQRLYIRVNMGWQAMTVGPVIPMDDGEFTNSLPSYMDESDSLFGDAAAASGSNQVSGMLRMFALNQPVAAGRLVGVSGADFMCYNQAKQAQVSGTFRAVLSTRQQSIDSLVFYKDQDLAIVNGRGERLLDSWSGVSKNKGYWADDVAIYTFDGININTDDRWSSRYFWHGATTTGEANTGNYCHAWTSTSSRELGVSSSYISGQVLDTSLHTCDSLLAVLCIETTLPDGYRR